MTDIFVMIEQEMLGDQFYHSVFKSLLKNHFAEFKNVTLATLRPNFSEL